MTLAPLTKEQIEQAAKLLKSARVENRLLDSIPSSVRPRTLEDAYAIQDRLVEILEADVGGWFCACTNPAIQSLLGLAEPYYARLLRDAILTEPATLNAANLPPLVLECEFAYRLGADLSIDDAPFTRPQVEDAIASVHPAIEVVAGHLKDWPKQDVYSVIADNGTDGALVYGEGTSEWQILDLVNMAISLTINGDIVRRGVGRNVLGDPLDAMSWLANARARAGVGLRAGDIHNTGTATEIYWVTAGDEARAEFEGLGSVSLNMEQRI
jgi:2-keto-4-pentenoate hydratase